eukprot:scaffold62930_cov48-Phaeocystis_antarctica.AAC.1
MPRSRMGPLGRLMRSDRLKTGRFQRPSGESSRVECALQCAQNRLGLPQAPGHWAGLMGDALQL